MRLVILESPFAGNVEKNLVYLRRCLRDSLLRGEAPIASHGLYTQEGVLDDMIQDERMLGIEAGLAWLRVADVSAFYIDHGMSEGMLHGCRAAQRAGVPREFRRIGPNVFNEHHRRGTTGQAGTEVPASNEDAADR